MNLMRTGVPALFGLFAVIIGFHTYRAVVGGSVTGQILPGNEVHSIVAVNGSDSVKILSNNGSFGLNLTPGKWKLVIPVHEKTPAYIERTLEVSRGQRIDLGQIHMLP